MQAGGGEVGVKEESVCSCTDGESTVKEKGAYFKRR